MPPHPISERQKRPFTEAYFWARVDKSGACWLWTKSTSHDGYGHVWTGTRSVNAHRVAWILTYGPVPKGLHVLHRCDVRACCNPSHLFLGTQADNNRDMTKKGRHAPMHGMANPNRHLTDDDVREIRALWATGNYPLAGIAAAFGVGETTVSHIIKGETWTTVT